MTVRVALRLRGLDLQDPRAYATIPSELCDLAFHAVGPMSYAVCFVERDLARDRVLECARRIHQHMSGVSVERVHDDLVTLSDIAERCSVSHEAARLWAAGRRRSNRRAFPEPYEAVSAGSSGRLTMLYQWPEVVAWVRDVVHIDPEDGLEFLDRASVAEIDKALADEVAFGQVVGQPALTAHGPSEDWRRIDTGPASSPLVVPAVVTQEPSLVLPQHAMWHLRERIAISGQELSLRVSNE
ncbi:hypothetical protein [Actinotalea sp. JY-7876]|uniref:hypothetical protein n=1 Tax=Actinotalea sp. JY-7876 TaxID=2758442 RepID=UPI0015F50C3D|nr:hypothetical protein [Actinotalea sp. JY-7876]